MAGNGPHPKPLWQTDDLAEEWIEEDEEEDGDEDEDGATSSAMDETETHPGSNSVGTFLVREEVVPSPIGPKTPGRNNNKNLFIKDFFSPLALERMFEPPLPTSPPQDEISYHFPPPNPTAPAVPSRLSRVHYPDTSVDSGQGIAAIGADVGNEPQDSGSSFEEEHNHGDGQGAFLPQSKFTFTLPVPNMLETEGAQAQSTPMPPRPPNAPPTDPRLRLFQFQYDTFTRDHLSAIVDSLDIPGSNTGSNKTPNLADPDDHGQYRSNKRIKLSPASDFVGPSIRRDYIAESKSLMHQIKRGARDVSHVSLQVDTSSSNASTPNPQPRRTPSTSNPSRLKPPENSSQPSSEGSKRSAYSSLAYRAQAADLMAQIRNDMKGHKRLFSVTSDGSHTTHVAAEENKADDQALKPIIIVPPPPVTVFSVRAAQVASPRRILRRLSAADEVDRELAQELSVVSDPISPPAKSPRKAAVIIREDVSTAPPSPMNINVLNNGHLAPPIVIAPALPSGTMRSATNEDLNRFVSSSTATGTTLTVGSVPSFTKHAGSNHMTHIGPQDIPALPNRIGKMVFDKNMMKWVKETALATAGVFPAEEVDGESEDPFRDIESLRDDSGRSRVVQEGELPKADEIGRLRTGSEDGGEPAEEEDITFSFDDPATGVVEVMTGVEEDATRSDISGDEAVDRLAASVADGFSLAPEVDEEVTEQQPQHQREPAVAQASLRNWSSQPDPLTTPVSSHRRPAVAPRSALKSANGTPVSAMKRATVTPVNVRGHRRSVSFSDGKTEGKIIGLDRCAVRDQSLAMHSAPPSAQTKRIETMLAALEDPRNATFDDDEEDDSPSKTSQLSSKPHRSDELPLFSERNGLSDSRRRRTFTRSPTVKPRSKSTVSNANTTFLTECSFGVAHDRLVQVITDVQPFEPYWHQLSSVDLSSKNLDSVARLKEFLPSLNTLYLSSNQLPWLSGVPGTVRTLSVPHNVLTSVTSFHHLLNLQSLDISHNEVDSLRQLSCLRHLQELKADANQIKSCDGLQRLDNLVKLSLHGNRIDDLDLRDFSWSKMEMLNVSDNALAELPGLSSLQNLVSLNVDNNALTAVEAHRTTMPKLRILRASGNKLSVLNVGSFPNLKTLYADGNALAGVKNGHKLAKLESLSLRSQTGRVPQVDSRDVRDVRRLYLSGNPISTDFLDVTIPNVQPCYNLVYLELAGCRLTSLAPGLATTIPNVRVLNLNYNFLDDLSALTGLKRLKKLSVVGGRLGSLSGVVRILRGMPEMEMVDFRMNPATLPWYLPLLVNGVPQHPLKGGCGGTSPTTSSLTLDPEWAALDGKFRRDLADNTYVARLAWRGMAMSVCSRLRVVDGLEVNEKERVKAMEVIATLRARPKGMATGTGSS